MAEPQIPLQNSPPPGCTAFIRNALGAAWLKDLNGRYVLLNKAAEAYFRTGCSDFDLFGTRVAEDIRRNDRRAMESFEGIEVIEWLPSESGPKCVVVRKFAIPDDRGRPVFIGAIASDGSDFKEQLLDSSSDCIKLVDRAGNLLYMNAGERKVMAPEESPIGKSWLSSWPEPGRSAARTALAEALAGNSSRFQGICPTAAGAMRWWDVRLTPLWDPHTGRRVLIVSHDITEQRLAEERAHLLYELSTAVSRAIAPHDIYQAAIRALIAGVGADRASVLIADADQVVRFKAWRGLSDEYRQAVEGHTPWQPGTKDASPITVPDVAADESLAHYLPVFRREGLAALAFIPLITQNGVIGKFMLYYDRPHQFTESEIQLAETIATHVAFATERQLREQAIRENEERFRSLSACSPVGIFTADDEGRCTYTNGSYRDICGRNGSTWFCCIDPAERDRISAEWRAAAAAGRSFSREVPFLDGAGHSRWAHVRTNPITVAGAASGHVGTVEDITEVRRLHTQLSERLHDLTAILQVAPVGIGIAQDAAGESFNANAYLRKLAPQEIAKEPIRFAIESGQESGPIEYQFRREDGSVASVLTQARPLLTPDGRVRGAVASFVDITARKAAEEKLRDAHTFLWTLVESSPLPILVFDTAGLITVWNPAAERVFGWSAEEVLGRPIPFIPEDKRGEHEWMRRQDLFGTGFTDREIRRKRRDGTLLDLHVSTSALRNAKGDITAVMSLYVDVTERRRAHDDLEQANERLRLALQAGDMRAWEWVIGGPTPEFEWVHAEDRTRVAAEIAQAVKERRVWRSEYHESGADGSKRWMMGVGQLSGDDQSRFIGLAVDITWRKNADQLLRESEERMLFAMNAAEMAVWEWTPNTGAVRRAGDLYDTFGLDTDEPMTRFFETVHPEDRAVLRDSLQNSLQERTPFEEDFRMIRPDGSVRWMSGRGRVKVDPERKSVRMFGVLMDVTAKKQAALALARSEQRLQAIIENSGAAIFMKDSAGKYLLVNSVIERLMNLPRRAAVGKTDSELTSAEHAERLRSHDLAVLRSGRAMQFEESLPTTDGLHYFIATKFPITDPESGNMVVCGIATDVTERKRLEEKLRDSAKLESLGILAGGIAHDFNNLLTGILGSASLLNMDPATPPASRQLADQIMASAQRAAQLTNQMLAYAGKGRFVTEPVDVSAHVREITSLLHAALPKNVQVIVDAAGDAPLVEADSGQLQQVIMNLVINGAEAIESGRGTVTIRTGTQVLKASRTIGPDELGPGTYVVITVSDNGVGMTPATQARIFDPFFTTKFTGRGLGLAAVQGIIRSHRGAIAVASTPGEGTNFEVWLPVMEPPAAMPVPERGPGSFAAAGTGLVLVVDDEDVVRRTASLMLSRHGYRVLEAVDGGEALRLYAEHGRRIVLVLLDMMMPNMSGGETLQGLREAGAECPVIAMSGYTAEEAQRQFGPGMREFVQKPFTASRLLAAVGRCLGEE